MDHPSKYDPIPLTLNRKYETFQFFAYANQNKDPEATLVTCVLYVFSWLRQKLINCSIPEDIAAKEPEDDHNFDFSDLRSFRTEDNNIIEVVLVKEKGIWAFRLIENDTGTSDRIACAGRTFETNIAFRIFNGKLEFALKTLCSQPRELDEDCKVFRPKLIRDIANSPLVTLEHISQYSNRALKVHSNDTLKDLIDFVYSRKRQLPIVVFTEKTETKNIDLEELLKATASINKFEQTANSEPKICFDYDRISNSLIGYAFAAVIPSEYFDKWQALTEPFFSLKRCRSCIIYPFQNKKPQRNEIKFYNEQFIRLCKFSDKKGSEAFVLYLKENLPLYLKNNHAFSYENIVFLLQAQDEERMIKYQNKADSFKLENLETHIEILKKQLNDFKEKNTNLEKRSMIVEVLGSELTDLKNRLAENEEELSMANKKLKKERAERQKDFELWRSYPQKSQEIPNWINEKYGKQIVLLHRAKKELEKCSRNIEIEILCEGIHYLATDYYDYRSGNSDIDENRYRWEVTSPGKQQIKNNPDAYNVKYNSKKHELDSHIKKGIDPKSIIRVYFFWDDDEKKIVIGSLPDHL